MYQSTLENVKSSFQPLVELAELNRKTLEKITAAQTNYLTDCISTSIKQAKTLAEAGSPQRATELSFEAIKQFEAKLTGVTEHNISALKELHNALNSLINDSCSDNYSRVTELYSLKDKFSVFTDTATAAFKPAVSPAPVQETVVAKAPAKKAAAKKATVTKTPAAAEKVTAKPANIPADKAALIKAAAEKIAAEKAAADKVAVKAAPKSVVTDNAPAAKKATVKRAVAKPAAKKAAAKPVVKKAAIKKPVAKVASNTAEKVAKPAAARPVVKAKPTSARPVKASPRTH